jgi:GNAT superfamily N-acetyltransferase
MRGQKLYVRPIEPGDRDAIRSFLAAHTNRDAVPACGLIGKLLGELVAVLAIDLSDAEGIRIEDLTVVPELRRKRIGRVMMNEVASLAAKMDRNRIIAIASGSASEFLRHVGFVDDGDRMVRRVER